MFPNSLHFIKYKSFYLGEPAKNKVFAFVKAHHAEFIKSTLKYENFNVSNTDNMYKIYPNTLKKPINRKFIKIEEYDPNVSYYFTHVNNVNLVIIDDIKYKNDIFTLYSNYSFDIALMEEWTKQYHFERMFLKGNNEKINYEDEFENVITHMINTNDDYDDSH
jgi:hypothetical protein